MMQKYRISTNIGKDQKVVVELKENFDLLEILSLKFTQTDVYSSMCSDYGVICGRISVNDGFGIPNAKISIFIPIKDEDVDNPVISALYPYTTIEDKNESGYRYNLLPSRQQHGGHAATGTFPDQTDILTREEILEVYEKYYNFTVKTNNAGDFMIWGVPVGTQILHVDVDLSDIGCFSLRPDDFIRQGMGVDSFKNEYTFKSSTDIDTLPQIVTFNQSVEVYPFWGNEDLCEIGITRTDFDLSDRGVKIEPKAYLIGGTFTDTGKNSVNKNCMPRRKMGRKCDLISKKGTIEAIRFTTNKDSDGRPLLEYLETNEDIEEDGAFILPLPMNIDYLYTNEFGENEYTNDSNKGIPTAACYRLRFSLSDDGLERVRANADYLVPNIREYSSSVDQSYAFSTNYDDYPTHAISNYILNNVDGFYIPQDYFYRFNYNKVYTVSSFQGSYFKGTSFLRDEFLGIKEIAPTEEEDCSSSVLTPPVNFGIKNYTFQLLIADILLFFDYLISLVLLTFFNGISRAIHVLASAFTFKPIRKIGIAIHKFGYKVQEQGQRKLYLINYPECEECSDDEITSSVGDLSGLEFCDVMAGYLFITGSTDEFIPSTPDRKLVCDMSSVIWSFFSSPPCDTMSGVDIPGDEATFLSNQITPPHLYGLTYTATSSDGTVISGTIQLSANEKFETNIEFNDIGSVFTESLQYSCKIVDLNSLTNPLDVISEIEDGCSLYDAPYDENIIEGYYTSNGTTSIVCPFDTVRDGSYVAKSAWTGGIVAATKLSDYINWQLPCIYDDKERYTPITKSGYAEFSNGVFYIIPGALSVNRILKILGEYRRRKRVGTMFCGGIVNYAFIDNWLSGSLYFFQFKAKVRWDNEDTLDRNNAHTKYCEDVVYHKIKEYSGGTAVKKFYYRSSVYDSSLDKFGKQIAGLSGPYRLNHPTTFVDLGPRDEFIKEICTDPSLDPNCSVSRQIGPTSFKSFGEIMGLAINYRLDTQDPSPSINSVDEFFHNKGFSKSGFGLKVLDGDILQLISINNEAGIEEFDLQSPKYIGYSYQMLDPETYPQVFKPNGYWGPVPITFYLDEDGQRIRLCLNEPTHLDYNGNTIQGRLTESAQNVPFFLWDKKGTGFGGTTIDTSDDQSWDYTQSNGIVVKPLQGMTYAYKLTGAGDDSSDKYLLLPITYTFAGLTIPGSSTPSIDFDVISTTDKTAAYDTQYPGFTYLFVTSGTEQNPIAGQLYTRYGAGGTWNTTAWTTAIDFIIRQTEDYYDDPNGGAVNERQILSTPFLFYFGLRPGNTGMDKFIKRFGPKGAFPSAE